jgi:hypothetical protein
MMSLKQQDQFQTIYSINNINKITSNSSLIQVKFPNNKRKLKPSINNIDPVNQ